MTVELGTLKKGDVLDEWYKLNAVAHKREIKGSEIGTIRLKARYTVSIACFLFPLILSWIPFCGTHFFL